MQNKDIKWTCQRIARFVSLSLLVLELGVGKAAPKGKYSSKDIDALMERVGQHADMNIDTLRNYVFNEKETWDNNLKNLKTLDYLKSFRREYVWVHRDGYLVRCPVSINGVPLSVAEQNAGEEQWIAEQQKLPMWKSIIDYFVDFVRYANDTFNGYWRTKTKSNTKEFVTVIEYPPGWTAKPKFVAGKYRYVGEEQLDGRNLVAIDYVLEKNDSGIIDLGISGRKIEHITGGVGATLPNTIAPEPWRLHMLVDPEEQQIVRRTYSNYSPCTNRRYEYSLTMSKPNGDEWLPKEFSVFIDLKRLYGTYRYTRAFDSYARAEVKARFWNEEVTTKIIYDTKNVKP